ncbi:membrane-associated phospholipid phosphatase [Dysgonomonadaceae bacterium PH5-43]|nr:membrane-associated phospholipid phosphatase [Dysgonomonadaceae bacterium PH5-43]
MKDFLLKNKCYYATFILFTIMGGTLLLLVNRDDINIWINSKWTYFLDDVILFINGLGTVSFSVAAVVVLALWKGWRTALKATICFASVALVTQFAKHILFPATPRPTLHFEEGMLRLIEGVKQLTTESFPSGHTSASFALSTFFALLLPKKNWHWAFAALALFVGYGRIYLSQHFFTDVYTGMIIGVVVTTLVYYYYPKSWENASKNKKIHRKAKATS